MFRFHDMLYAFHHHNRIIHHNTERSLPWKRIISR